MAVKTDKATQLVLDCLTRAFAAPAGCPLYGKGNPALFPSTAAARRAAQQCKAAGWLQTVRTEAKGKSAVEICAITEIGIAHLLSHARPQAVLEEFIRAVEARGKQIAEAVAAARQGQAALEAMHNRLLNVLNHMQTPNGHVAVDTLPALLRTGARVRGEGTGSLTPDSSPPRGEGRDGPSSSKGDGRECPSSARGEGRSNGSPARGAGCTGAGAWQASVLAFLAEWCKARPSDDCPLPELFRQVRRSEPNLTIGQFHDELRRLHADGPIYLHPWTGPLSEIPEPAIALLVGHMIAYYASQREMNNEERTVKNEP